MKVLLNVFALSLALVAGNAFAGDASTFRNVGFSPDGKYFAFLQFGEQDGSGFPYADIQVVNVAENTVAAFKSVVMGGENDEPSGSVEQAVKKALKTVGLEKFGIKAGKNLGDTLLARMENDFSSYSNTIFSLDYWAEGGASMPVAKYEVMLTEKNAPDTSEGQWCSDMSEGGPKMISLSVVGRERTSGATYLLQDDTHLPKSRGCALSYSVKRVIKNGKSLVIVVNFSSVGFEGPDYRYMVVTGTPDLQ